jgi:hypothetical protein
MHCEYVSKLQLLYPVDEHHGYCPNLCAAAGVASLVMKITAAKISRKRFIGDTIIEEPSSATAHLLRGSEHRAVAQSWAFPTALFVNSRFSRRLAGLWIRNNVESDPSGPH